jgi:hypothetical protein
MYMPIHKRTDSQKGTRDNSERVQCLLRRPNIIRLIATYVHMHTDTYVVSCRTYLIPLLDYDSFHKAVAASYLYPQ